MKNFTQMILESNLLPDLDVYWSKVSNLKDKRNRLDLEYHSKFLRLLVTILDKYSNYYLNGGGINFHYEFYHKDYETIYADGLRIDYADKFSGKWRFSVTDFEEYSEKEIKTTRMYDEFDTIGLYSFLQSLLNIDKVSKAFSSGVIKKINNVK